ncbi:MAG: adenine-specific methyltransferase EcoRI family protein [Bacteroidales bacterium]|nr:adenine-specific methyltransferase EcoRI family protein [Bacteroidales bacterium]
MANRNLNAAKEAKKDEFYTQLSDIENELRHYKEHFRGKTVLCNCDDPYESNFFKYFALNFNSLGLKKLIATCYDGSPITGQELQLFTFDDEGEDKRIAYKVEITEVKDENGDGVVNLADVQYLLQNDKNVLTLLKGHGDFRSAECIELLKKADIVCTNPPFSLFREYVAQLIKYQKKFLILGNINTITTKDMFSLIRDNKMWLGITRHGTGSMWFRVPDNYPVKSGQKIIDGIRYQTIGSSAWFTNMDHKKRHEELILYKTYTQEEYPRYDNYDAINVDKSLDIPCDYDGIMGVPITFIDKYNPEQFEIVGNEESLGISKGRGYVNGKRMYSRIFIRRK